MAINNPVLYFIAVVAIVAMWRGLGGLMDLYLWPKNPKRSYLVSLLIGIIIMGVVLALVSR